MCIKLAINVHFQRNRTPLIAACEEHRSETAQFLIEKGADLNKQDEVCKTVIFSCYQYIKILVVRPCVCVCVTDVGVAVMNLRVVCKIVTCVSAFTEIFSNLS